MSELLTISVNSMKTCIMVLNIERYLFVVIILLSEPDII